MAVPKDVPFGTTIELEGLGIFTAHDRGSAIQRIDENTIKVDIWHPTHEEAWAFGVQEFESVLVYPKEAD